MTSRAAQPVPTLTIADAVLIIVGVVVGAGIFKAPSLVAANAGSGEAMMLIWLAGGAMALIGALCYAELASAYPNAGGDYHFLMRAFGSGPAFLFAWARMTVMQTGSIALLAYAFGDYASQFYSLGEYSSAIYAALAVVALTIMNLIGIRQGKGTQWLFTSIEVLGLIALAAAGLALASPQPAVEQVTPPSQSALGLAMVFVLLTYGGWNEAAYVSAEVRGSQRAIVRALVLSIGIITALYLVVNLAYIHALGLNGMAKSDAVAADLMQRVFGDNGARFVGLLVAVSAITSINATILTGARSNYALGRDFRIFSFLGRWHERANTPTNALLVQGVIALLLVLLGTATRTGFATMVEYTAPVFWLFFLLTGVSLFRLRGKEPDIERPFRVPLYPLTPLVFCASSAYMLWSSLNYTGIGALTGVAVLLVGLPVLWLARRRQADGGD